MSAHSRSAFALGSASALALLLAASPALSLTADEMWQGWVDYYASMGQEVTVASKAMEGDTLVVKDAVFATKMAPDMGSFSLSFPELRMQEVAGGSVVMTMSETFSGKIVNPKPAEGEAPTGPAEMDLAGTQSGLKVTASGTKEDTRYEAVGDTMTVSLSAPGASNKDPGMSMSMALSGLTSTSTMKTAAGHDIAQDFTANSVEFKAAGTDPENGGSFEMSGKMGPMTGKGVFFMPENVNMEKMDEALKAGLKMSGSMTLGAGSYAMSGVDEEGATFKATSASDSGQFDFSMDKNALVYNVEAGKSDISVEGAKLPMPLTGTLASSAFGLTLPWGKSDTASDAALKLKLVDLTLSDGIWDMFDPAKQLSRDPATLVLDLAAKLKMTSDLYDPAVAETEGFPGEIEKLDLLEVFAKLAGADVSATGGVTFDNSMGMPMPLGAIDVKANGVVGLMDKLAAMGLVPADAMMGVKAMIGVFGKAVGDDQYTSKIEFKEGMQIFANGMPIPMGQ